MACLVAGLLTIASAVRGGSVYIGPVTPPQFSSVGGIVFDNVEPGKPLVATGLHASRLQRLDPSNAAVLSTIIVTEPYGSRGLAFASPGVYYKTSNNPKALYQFNPFINTSTQIGSSLTGGSFNFLDIALDPTTGKLWAVSDSSPTFGGTLYEIDRTTGVASVRRTINLSTNMHVVSMAIDLQGQFYFSSYHGSGLENQIFRIDPYGTSFTPVTTTGYFSGDFLSDFAQDPTTQNWYGVVEVRSASPRRWDFVRLTNVPEPAACAVLTLAVPLARRRRGT